MDLFARAVDATFRRLGIDGILDPDGVARRVRLIPRRPDAFADVGTLSIQSETGQYEIRPAEMDGFGKGAVLEIAGERRKVQTTPQSNDPRRLKLLLNTIAL